MDPEKIKKINECIIDLYKSIYEKDAVIKNLIDAEILLEHIYDNTNLIKTDYTYTYENIEKSLKTVYKHIMEEELKIS